MIDAALVRDLASALPHIALEELAVVLEELRQGARRNLGLSVVTSPAVLPAVPRPPPPSTAAPPPPSHAGRHQVRCRWDPAASPFFQPPAFPSLSFRLLAQRWDPLQVTLWHRPAWRRRRYFTPCRSSIQCRHPCPTPRARYASSGTMRLGRLIFFSPA
jgi:hypothetical protein